MASLGYGPTKPLPGVAIDWGHPLSRGLVFCALLNEGGGSALDVITKTPGTLTNGAFWAAGAGGREVRFDAVDDVINYPDSSLYSLGQSPITIEVWARANDVAQQAMMVSKRLASGNFTQWSAGFNLNAQFASAGRKFACLLRESGTVSRGTYTTADVLDGQLRQYVAVGDQAANLIRLYVDGANMATTVDGGVTTGAWPNLDTTQPIRIGDGNGANRFGGGIVLVRVWKRALTPAEIAQARGEPYAMFAAPSWRRYPTTQAAAAATRAFFRSLLGVGF